MNCKPICETISWGLFFGLILGGCYFCEKTEQEKERTKQEAIKAGLVERDAEHSGTPIWVKP